MNQDESLDKVIDMLSSGQVFALSKYCDGEGMILVDEYVVCGDKSFTYNPDEHKDSRDRMLKSLKNERDDFYYAIACKCHWPELNAAFRGVIKNENIFVANLFVNGNWERWTSFLFEFLKDKKVCMVVHENKNLDLLPFKVHKDFRLKDNALNLDHKTQDDVKSFIEENDIEGWYFLVAGGPYGPVLIDHCFDGKNTMIDIGSSLDIQMGVLSRRYQNNKRHRLAIYCTEA